MEIFDEAFKYIHAFFLTLALTFNKNTIFKNSEFFSFCKISY